MLSVTGYDYKIKGWICLHTNIGDIMSRIPIYVMFYYRETGKPCDYHTCVELASWVSDNIEHSVDENKKRLEEWERS